MFQDIFVGFCISSSKLKLFCFVLVGIVLSIPLNAAEQYEWKVRSKPIQGEFSSWEGVGKLSFPREFQGSIEYKTSISLTNEAAGMPLGIYLGQVGDADRVFINGRLIGQTGGFPPNYHPNMDYFREYLIPNNVLKSGQNELRIEAYVEYVAQKGVLLAEVEIGPHDELQKRKYTNECLWYFLKIGVPFLCLFMTLLSMPWASPNKVLRPNFLLFLTGLFYFLFGLGKSRVIFHFLPPLIAYKIITLSALSGLVCIFIYSIDLCTNRIRQRWPYAFAVGIPLAFATRIAMGSSMAETSLVVKDWLLASVPLNLIVSVGVLYYSWRHLKLRNFWILSGVFLLVVVAINDVLNNVRWIATMNLMDFGFCGFIIFMLMADAIRVRRAWVDLDAKKRTLQSAEWYSKKAFHIAHDIKSPMRSILKAVDELERRSSFGETVNFESVGVIKEGARRMTDVAQEIQDDFKEMSGDDSLRVFRNVLLDDLILSATKEASRIKPEKIVLETNGLNRSPHVWSMISPGGIKTAISNVINNAFEAFEHTTAKSKVVVSFSFDSSCAKIEIKDNGKGMSDEVLSRIFDERYTYGKISGTGLGLTQAKNEIEANGGSVEVESKLGLGTTVKITLPTDPIPDLMADEIRLKKNVPIYFVDDDSTVVNLWKEKFKAFNRDNYPVNFFHSLSDLPKESQKNSILVLDQYFGVGAIKATDWVKKYRPRSEVYICSSDYDDVELQNIAEQEKLFIIPKPWLGDVQIKI